MLQLPHRAVSFNNAYAVPIFKEGDCCVLELSIMAKLQDETVGTC